MGGEGERRKGYGKHRVIEPPLSLLLEYDRGRPQGGVPDEKPLQRASSDSKLGIRSHAKLRRPTSRGFAASGLQLHT